MAATSTQPATVYLQELRDGSWIGNASWGGRTLTDGATEPAPLLRRLAARLAALPGDRPASVKLTRVSRDGQRDEQDQDLAALLGS